MTHLFRIVVVSSAAVSMLMLGAAMWKGEWIFALASLVWGMNAARARDLL